MPRPLKDQVIVITGASSGIGRAAALRFGKAGASVVLAARNQTALEVVANEIRAMGAEALVVTTDVTSWEQVQHLAQQAVYIFGRIDTWVNDAGIGIIARIEDTTIEEIQQLMQINFMGMIHGVKAALPSMKKQGYGTIINISSVLGHRAVPLQGVYSASKHAVKGLSEALRLELQHDYDDIHTVVISPTGINTPFFNHAIARIGGMKPQAPPPMYKAELVAETIVHAAQHPQREIFVGGGSALIAFLQRLSPVMLDKLSMTGDMIFKLQKSNQPDDERDALFAPIQGNGRIEGDFDYLTKPSLYTPLFEMTPFWQRGLSFLAGIALFVFSTKRISRS